MTASSRCSPAASHRKNSTRSSQESIERDACEPTRMDTCACRQARLGFYPASPLAIGELLKHLRVVPPNPERKNDATNVIDPCCGEGAAIHQIATGLGVGEEHVHTVELDLARSERGQGPHAQAPPHRPGVVPRVDDHGPQHGIGVCQSSVRR